MRRRHVLVLPLVASVSRAAVAQSAVPFYTPPQFMHGLYASAYQPLAVEFAESASALARTVDALCAAPASGAILGLSRARSAWSAAAQAWDRLSAMAIGPLLQRKSRLQIDFSPARPRLIERALRSPPPALAEMDRVGAPAKGFPALEWLLWTRPVPPGTDACAYAAVVAHDIEREARALRDEVAALAARDWPADEAAAAMSEALNQWIGGLERLRWARMEKPLRAAAAGQAPEFPRQASGRSAEAWRASGGALLGLAAGAAPPPPGAGLVTWEAYLRGRGQNALADRLAEATAQAQQQMQAARPDDPTSVLAAAQALQALKRLGEAQLAPALDIAVGFSDNDGD